MTPMSWLLVIARIVQVGWLNDLVKLILKLLGGSDE